MYNRRYDKAFVMLRQDTNGFSLGTKPAWGNVAMEIKNGKGRVALTVQEFKPLPQGREYALYVIGGEKGTAKGVRCGCVPVDGYGRGELHWEFDPDNIDGSGLTAEELHTTAVLVEGRDSYGLIVPVAGYFGEAVNWKKRFQPYEKQTAVKTVTQPVPEMIRETAKDLEITPDNKTDRAVEMKPEPPAQSEEKEALTKENADVETVEGVQETVAAESVETEDNLEITKESIAELKEEPEAQSCADTHVSPEAGQSIESNEKSDGIPRAQTKEEPEAEPCAKPEESPEGLQDIEVKENADTALCPNANEKEDKSQCLEVKEVSALEDDSEKTPQSGERNFHQTFKDMIARFHKELAELEQAGVISPSDKIRIYAAGEPKTNGQSVMENQLNYICRQNTPIAPFNEEDRQWRCISMEELAVLPVPFLSFMRHPFFILPYRKYKHFIFGWNPSGICFLGVPDRYQPENRRLAQSLGFHTFLPVKGSCLEPDAMGYWLHEMGK